MSVLLPLAYHFSGGNLPPLELNVCMQPKSPLILSPLVIPRWCQNIIILQYHFYLIGQGTTLRYPCSPRARTDSHMIVGPSFGNAVPEPTHAVPEPVPDSHVVPGLGPTIVDISLGNILGPVQDWCSLRTGTISCLSVPTPGLYWSWYQTLVQFCGWDQQSADCGSKPWDCTRASLRSLWSHRAGTHNQVTDLLGANCVWFSCHTFNLTYDGNQSQKCDTSFVESFPRWFPVLLQL